MYYYYNNYCSVSLLAVTDENYRFIAVDVGCLGKDSDAGAFDNCPLRRAFASKQTSPKKNACQIQQ
jgi:hypothetical protein